MSVLILHRSGYAPCKMNRPKLKEIDWLRGDSILVGQRESTERMVAAGNTEYGRTRIPFSFFLPLWSTFFMKMRWEIKWDKKENSVEGRTTNRQHVSSADLTQCYKYAKYTKPHKAIMHIRSTFVCRPMRGASDAPKEAMAQQSKDSPGIGCLDC